MGLNGTTKAESHTSDKPDAKGSSPMQRLLKDGARYNSSPSPVASPLIAAYAGIGIIRNSPLVVDLLGNSTEPRAKTLFLETRSRTSFNQCTAVVEGDNVNVYKDVYLRWIFDNLQSMTAYNISLLYKVELVVPVVDCQLDVIGSGGAALARVNYLVRYKNETNRMLLLPASLAIQDYSIAEQYEQGSALLLTFSIVEDMASNGPVSHYYTIALDYPYEYKPSFEACLFYDHTSDGYWSLETIPRDPFMRPPKPLISARQLGFYIDKETSQANQINFYWDPADDPASALTFWNWHGDTVVRDNWAWVHIIHLAFAIDVMFQLVLLLFLVYRSILQRHLWIGDAFAPISNALLYRGIYVLIANELNGFWTLTDFSLALADSIGENPTVKNHPGLVHADMLTIYLNIVCVFSYLVRERVDPLLAVICFEVGFNFRESMTKIFPALHKVLRDYSDLEVTHGPVAVNEYKLSPMRLWTLHAVPSNRWLLIIATFIVIFSTILIIVLYVIVRKLMRHYSVTSQISSRSVDSKSLNKSRPTHNDSEPRELMQFETATGSVLKNRFGILSKYKNYMYIKSRRFASGDAIYCNGFVVANDKFVIATEDLMSLLIMKIARARFTNIYVYTITAGTGVNQTARLVYPSTISWHDLAKVSVSPLT
ncbi:uncharacterized protein PHALS_13229 [Plasmopara halstedii]|uniref:Transmembrane protein n=1 Tax=Plasmopara halstedii TaxID=4781 RepID=A0A0N7L614_PLAHL|nr:uncharacterized protein PHALS_13229 [Plasmopara halstedii]CEG43003.1 hypothetical protein PHALS_13229 [Plasmopara halstedii]|eukprot:XP_024579372.1 hypothetical protein PHALS_13229 [Plasmopara halstedii]